MTVTRYTFHPEIRHVFRIFLGSRLKIVLTKAS
jgi:hypothetical protein